MAICCMCKSKLGAFAKKESHYGEVFCPDCYRKAKEENETARNQIKSIFNANLSYKVGGSDVCQPPYDQEVRVNIDCENRIIYWNYEHSYALGGAGNPLFGGQYAYFSDIIQMSVGGVPDRNRNILPNYRMYLFLINSFVIPVLGKKIPAKNFFIVRDDQLELIAFIEKLVKDYNIPMSITESGSQR